MVKVIMRWSLCIIFGLLLISCQTTGNVKVKSNLMKGNLYGPYGKKMDGERVVEVLASFDPTGITRAVFDMQWASPEPQYVFKQFTGTTAGEGYTAFYTGVLKEKGPVYTWGYKIINVHSMKELIAETGFRKPVYVSVDGKTLPLTAVINDDGTISCGLGVKTDDYIYVGVDTIEEADIWYYYNHYSNKIRNNGFELGALSIVVGECSYAQAEANGLLLKDIARLTKCIEVAESDISNTQYDEMLKNLTKDKLAMLNQSLKKKTAIQEELTDAVSAAYGGIIKSGMDFSLNIAKDVEKMISWTLNLNAVAIAQYFIDLYGKDEMAQKYGKIANDNYDKMFRYGEKRINESKEILAKQKAVLKLINSSH